MRLSLKIAGVGLPCQMSGRCMGLLDAAPGMARSQTQSWHHGDTEAAAPPVWGHWDPLTQWSQPCQAPPAPLHALLLAQAIVQQQGQGWAQVYRGGKGGETPAEPHGWKQMQSD